MPHETLAAVVMTMDATPFICREIFATKGLCQWNAFTVPVLQAETAIAFSFLDSRTSEFLREDEVGAELRADLEGTGAGFDETVAAIEGDGAGVAGVGAEQEAVAAKGVGVGDGGVKQGLRGAEAFFANAKLVHDGCGAEAGEEVDALEFDVGGQDVEGGELGSAKHGVTDGSAAGDRGESDAGCGIGEVGLVGGGDVVFGAVRDDVRAGEHPGEGFEEGGRADEGERGGVGGCGGAEGEGFGVWSSFGGVKRHVFSRSVDGKAQGMVG